MNKGILFNLKKIIYLPTFKKDFMKRALLVLISLLTGFCSYGQDDETTTTGAELTNNVERYSAKFLTIAPDSRAGAMGDAGVATSADGNSLHWNPSKFAFIENDMSISVSYTPWLRNLVSDIDLGYLSGHYRLDEEQVISASLFYFSLGEIIFKDRDGYFAGQHSPNEFSLDAAYARKFGEHFSGGIAFRYIRSDLTGGINSSALNGKTSAGNAVAADVSMFYQNKGLEINDNEFDLRFGMNIQNVGSKISYRSNRKNFIPTNLKLGGSIDFKLDEYNSLMFTMDLNKLLVPTPNPNDTTDNEVSVPQAMVQSFYDAPGGLEEELNEIRYSTGIEYWYQDAFAIRGGYFHEHQTKGNRKYFTVGLGLKLNVFRADFSYLIPRYQNNPLANTMRFTIALDFEALREKQKSD